MSAGRPRTTSAAIRTTAPEPIDYYVWAITGPSGTFVVDTGFDAAMAKKRGRVISKPIAEGLKAIDIAPDSIKNVIVSHLHYDHCGNYDTFPNARYHLQDTEMAYATGRCMCHQHLRVPFEEEDVVAMVRKVFAGRVTFHDGVSQVAPGITVHKIGGHSKGLQCVRVKTKRGPVVHRLGHDPPLLPHRAGPRVSHHLQCGRSARRLRNDEKARRLAVTTSFPGTIRWCIERYPAARAGLEGWVGAARRGSERSERKARRKALLRALRSALD